MPQPILFTEFLNSGCTTLGWIPLSPSLALSHWLFSPVYHILLQIVVCVCHYVYIPTRLWASYGQHLFGSSYIASSGPNTLLPIVDA